MAIHMPYEQWAKELTSVSQEFQSLRASDWCRHGLIWLYRLCNRIISDFFIPIQYSECCVCDCDNILLMWNDSHFMTAMTTAKERQTYMNNRQFFCKSTYIHFVGTGWPKLAKVRKKHEKTYSSTSWHLSARLGLYTFRVLTFDHIL